MVRGGVWELPVVRVWVRWPLLLCSRELNFPLRETERGGNGKQCEQDGTELNRTAVKNDSFV